MFGVLDEQIHQDVNLSRVNKQMTSSEHFNIMKFNAAHILFLCCPNKTSRKLVKLFFDTSYNPQRLFVLLGFSLYLFGDMLHLQYNIFILMNILF